MTDLRTAVSGVRFANLRDAPTFEDVQGRVSKLLKDKILVGHGLENDLQVRRGRPGDGGRRAGS